MVRRRLEAITTASSRYFIGRIIQSSAAIVWGEDERTFDYIATLRRNLRLGLYHLEARVLSEKCRVEKFPEVLRHATQHCRGELYLSPQPHRESRNELGCRHGTRLPLRSQSQSIHYAH